MTEASKRDIRFDDRRSLGDYSDGVPPLPIPNREVKPASADGTALVGEGSFYPKQSANQFLNIFYIINNLKTA